MLYKQSLCKLQVVVICSILYNFFSHLPVAELKAEAARIEHETELDCQTQAREAEINFVREQNLLEVSKAKELSTIEVYNN